MIHEFLDTWKCLPKGARVCLYGAGEGGAIALACLKEKRKDIQVVCFIDDYQKGDKKELPIFSLQEIAGGAFAYDFILVTSAYWRDISRALDKQRIKNFFIVNMKLLFPCHIYSRAEMRRYNPLFKQAARIFLGKDDRRLYELLVAQRGQRPGFSEDPFAFFRHVNGNESEEYRDFLHAKRIHTILEGGVYDGKNTARFLECMPWCRYIYGFEPLLRFYRTGSYYKKLKKKPVHVYPFALWKKNQMVKFYEPETNKLGSTIIHSRSRVSCNNGSFRSIQGIAIDDFVKSRRIDKVDFIKLDVEGNELEALQGGRHTLLAHRPQLAVCIYHDKRDLYRIPLFLKGILKDYVYRLGHYTSSFWDTVLYSIPRECYGG